MKIRIVYIKIFFITLCKVVLYMNKQKYYLFNLIPILKIKAQENKIKYYLFHLYQY